MTEPMKVEITLDSDVVERLLEEPILRGPESKEEHEIAYNGGPTTYPVGLEELLNATIRSYPRQSDMAAAARQHFIQVGAKLGDPGYQELWEQEYGE